MEAEKLEELMKIAEQNREVLSDYKKSGKLPEPRALTRSERKQLDAAGLNILKMKRDDPRTYTEVRDEMYDWILDNVYSSFAFPEDLPNNICNAFADFTFGMTYRDDLSAKNL